jgi:hypothetical protein
VIKKETFETELLVLNWNERRKLLPEVSSLRYSDYYWDAQFKFEEKIQDLFKNPVGS